MVSWNVHGLNTINQSDILDYLEMFDIITLPETWTNNDSDVSEIFDGYIPHLVHGKRRSRHGRNPGGIAMFVKKSIAHAVKLVKKTELGSIFENR